MKRYLIAGAVALTFGAGSFAFANSLIVDSDTLASGSDTVDSGCASIAVHYTNAYGEDNTYNLDQIELEGGVGCVDQNYMVTVANSTGVTLWEYAGALAGGNDTFSAAAESIDAASVGNVTAVVTNSELP
ncbi:MAG: hypothetical protein WD691_11390 [Acidimicrobiales bacterium]